MSKMIRQRLINRLIQKVGRYYSTNVQPIQMAFNAYETKPSKSDPLVIMHGLFGSKQNWRGVSRALEAKANRKVFAVDARNHGDSPHTTDHSSACMAADVVELLRTHNHNRAAVMGHSMGGRTMMHLALQHPKHVERAIIVDISPIAIPRDFFSMEQIFQAMLNISVPSNLPMSQGRALVEAQMKQAVDDQDTVNFIMLNLRKRDNGEFYWAPNVAGLLHNLRKFSEFMQAVKKYPPYEGPVMFICGKHSNFVNPDDWPAIQQIFPNSEIHWLDAGHLVHLEQPAKFVDLVVNFLKQ